MPGNLSVRSFPIQKNGCKCFGWKAVNFEYPEKFVTYHPETRAGSWIFPLPGLVQFLFLLMFPSLFRFWSCISSCLDPVLTPPLTPFLVAFLFIIQSMILVLILFLMLFLILSHFLFLMSIQFPLLVQFLSPFLFHSRSMFQLYFLFLFHSNFLSMVMAVIHRSIGLGPFCLLHCLLIMFNTGSLWARESGILFNKFPFQCGAKSISGWKLTYHGLHKPWTPNLFKTMRLLYHKGCLDFICCSFHT